MDKNEDPLSWLYLTPQRGLNIVWMVILLLQINGANNYLRGRKATFVRMHIDYVWKPLSNRSTNTIRVSLWRMTNLSMIGL